MLETGDSKERMNTEKSNYCNAILSFFAVAILVTGRCTFKGQFSKFNHWSYMVLAKTFEVVIFCWWGVTAFCEYRSKAQSGPKETQGWLVLNLKSPLWDKSVSWKSDDTVWKVKPAVLLCGTSICSALSFFFFVDLQHGDDIGMRVETSWNGFVLFFNVDPGIFKWSDFRLGKLGKASLHFTCNIQVSYFCCRWHREWWTTCRLRWDIPRHDLLTLLCKLSRNTGWWFFSLVPPT